MVRITVHELRPDSQADLLSQLKDLKTELSARSSATPSSPVAPLKHLGSEATDCAGTCKAALREAYKNKYLPLDLRPKKTRAIRSSRHR